MWIVFAVGSAFFAGITAILAKFGIKEVNSNLATAIRTVVVLIFSWLIVVVTKSFSGIGEISSKTLIFLILSGLATGVSWLCYFQALKIGDINKVTPVDKSSTVLTMILAFIFFDEKLTWISVLAIFLIGIGIFLMIEKKKNTSEKKGKAWFIYAFGSAVFASLTSILAKIGIENINSNLGTAIRTLVVFIMAWLVVFMTNKQKEIPKIDRKSWRFLIFSGLSTGGSWLCYYHALQTGPASVVVPIDKLSILITIAFSYLVFGEKLLPKAIVGLLMIVIGTLALLI